MQLLPLLEPKIPLSSLNLRLTTRNRSERVESVFHHVAGCPILRFFLAKGGKPQTPTPSTSYFDSPVRESTRIAQCEVHRSGRNAGLPSSPIHPSRRAGAKLKTGQPTYKSSIFITYADLTEDDYFSIFGTFGTTEGSLKRNPPGGQFRCCCDAGFS